MPKFSIRSIVNKLFPPSPEREVDFPSFFLIRMMQENRENGESECEEVVGSRGEVDKLAEIYVNDGLAIEMLEHFLTETYMRSNILTDGERKVAREVGALIPKFLADCFVERQAKIDDKNITKAEEKEAYEQHLKTSGQKRVF